MQASNRHTSCRKSSGNSINLSCFVLETYPIQSIIGVTSTKYITKSDPYLLQLLIVNYQHCIMSMFVYHGHGWSSLILRIRKVPPSILGSQTAILTLVFVAFLSSSWQIIKYLHSLKWSVTVSFLRHSQFIVKYHFSFDYTYTNVVKAA
jgi:hypothetical protein